MPQPHRCPSGGVLLGILAAILATSGSPLSASDDGLTLSVRSGFVPGEVRLDWTGGTPTFSIYRSSSPLNVADPANKIGETSGRAWLDTPPDAPIIYYVVTSPCVPAAEICNGLDDDCDGTPDDGCVAGCEGPADCPSEQFCDPSGECLPDLPDGGACEAAGECLGGHCQNGYCCAAGDCCLTASDCASYSTAPLCESAADCQGRRAEAICAPTFQCASQSVDDDSGCLGLLSDDCGLYPSVFCTGAVTQPADQGSLCAVSCESDAGCDAAAHCDGSQCLPDLGAGAACDEASDCQAGLFCTDGVCCTSTCGGTCMACDLAGSLGTCAPVPLGQDPDAECGGVSCAGFYWGWLGDTCYRRADVSASLASCNGSGACRSAALECSTSARGTAYLTCNSQCQDPNLSTCTGTTAGTCTNVNPGSQTCGTGPCQVTVPQCVNGSPNSCVPNSGAASPETCNDIDDNCDGTVDNGSFADALEPNNSCSGPRTLSTVGSNATVTHTTMTLYPSGDVDYYIIPAVETDSSCECCDFFCTDEDYRLTIRLTVPTGAGSYRFCTGTSCADIGSFCQNVAAGQTLFWEWTLDGSCGLSTDDSYTRHVSVAPAGSPGYECRPYTLSYTFTPGCF